MSTGGLKLRIALLTTCDPFNRQSGSGTFYYMLQALQRYCGEVVCSGPMQPGVYLLGQMIDKAVSLLLNKRFSYYNSSLLARCYAHLARKKLQDHPCDVIVAPFATVSTAFLETTLPIILVEDATFALLHNYYPQYSNLLCRSIREAHELTACAFRRASRLVFSSAWAAQSAMMDYGVAAEKIQIIPFGANIELIPDQQFVMSKARSLCCKLLFVGLDWQRKGGDIALETLLSLERQGIEAELVMCGCRPPRAMTHERLQVIPYLNNNDPRQRKALAELYAQADFFLLPTRSDCTPCVFCEAGAFGLPVLTADTGGISCIISNGINGFVLPYQARGTAYAEVIARTYRDTQLYTALRRSSRALFDTCLNWDAWGFSMQCLLNQL
jgi:glycosyltransferase involved in cell wall biosynthesis